VLFSHMSVHMFAATGVKAVDTLTPLGRGASLLVIGPHNSGKTTLAVDAILGQRASGVKCVVASTTLTAQQLEQRLKVGSALNRLCRSCTM
jgi:F-type H+-transporting ATPase subunit alpha